MQQQELEKYWHAGINYCSYREMMESLVKEQKTSGPNQTEALINYTKLNLSRMKKWEKMFVPSVRATACLRENMLKENWLIITEAWCGDAAQNIPQIQKLANLLINVQTRYIFRDEHPELIDAFLTNGTRSIPKLIRLSPEFEVMGVWGPRPAAAQQLVLTLKSKPEMPAEDRALALHSWYNQNAGKDLETEFLTAFQQTAGTVC